MINHSRTCAGLLLLLVLVSLNHCRTQAPLAEVAPPNGFTDLDYSVQSQYNARWATLTERKHKADSEHGEAWGALGLWYQAYQYSVSADRCYQNAMLLDGADPRWPYYRGMIAREAGDLAQARTWFMASAAAKDDVIPGTLELASLAYNDQNTEQAAQHYQTVLAIEPQQPGALFGMAEIHLSRGEAERAIPLLEDVLSQQPHASEALYSMGRALSMIGERERAKDFFDAVPQQNNEHQPLNRQIDWLNALHRLRSGGKELTRRGWQAFQMGDFEKAAFYAGKAIREDPSNAELHTNYAVVLKAMKRPMAAFESLKKAMQLAPENPRAFLVTGTLLLEQKRLTGAEQHLRKAVELDPRAPDGHLQLGRLFHLQGQYEKACQQYGQVRKLDTIPDIARFWHTALLFALARPEQALPLLEKDRTFLPQNRLLRLLHTRALVTLGAGREDHINEARRLLSAEDDRVDGFFAETAAMVAARSGDFDTAIRWQQAAVDALDDSSMRIASMIARRRLALYSANEICQNPWQVNEPINNKPLQAPSR